MADTSPITLLPTPAAIDPVAAPLRDVAALFASELNGVRFPDLDAKVLNGAIVDVEAATAEVARLEAAVNEARKKLDEAHDTLVGKAARGLAYARIFADGNADLLTRLDGITLPRARRGAAAPVAAADAPKKRGRKPASASGETLFAGSSSSISTLPTEVADTDGADGVDHNDEDEVAHAAE